MKLLDFVALYGMVLMPMGAVVFIDFWFFDRLGLRRNYADDAGTSFNWAAGLTWFLTLAICLRLVFWIGRWSLWFVSLPGWFIAALMYILLSYLFQTNRNGSALSSPGGTP